MSHFNLCYLPRNLEMSRVPAAHLPPASVLTLLWAASALFSAGARSVFSSFFSALCLVFRIFCHENRKCLWNAMYMNRAEFVQKARGRLTYKRLEASRIFSRQQIDQFDIFQAFRFVSLAEVHIKKVCRDARSR